jgi:hypothetical protein
MIKKYLMTKHHRINVWRIANKCPVCGTKRGYSPANPNGIECYCSNEECGYSEMFSNSFIHISGGANDNARFEVLDSNNKLREGWYYIPVAWEQQAMEIAIKEFKEDKKRRKEDKNKIYANCGNEVYCRKIEDTAKIEKCSGCAYCEEHGFESNDLEFSKCRYPLKKI